MIEETCVVDLIKNIIKDDPSREGLLKTPARYCNALQELTWGQRENEDDFLKTLATVFEGSTLDGTSVYDELVLVKGIEFVSLCEHHILNFQGKVCAAYITGDENKIIGLSKFSRLVQFYAARLQVQERMTMQIAHGLQKLIPDARGVGVLVEATHSCMCIRGVKSIGSTTTTSTLLGCFKNKDTRTEFFSHCYSSIIK